MVRLVGDEFLRAAHVTRARIGLLSPSHASMLRQRVRDMFSNTGNSRWLWEGLHDCASHNDRNGWKLIGQFLKDQPSIVFFDEHEDQRAFSVASGGELMTVLGESYGYEFYVTDDRAEFLFCFNHHDYLIACGTAVSFLRQVVKNR